MDVPPRVTLFSELPADALADLLQRSDVQELFAAGRVGLSMAMLDLSTTRARCIRVLEDQGVEVTAWLLLDECEGYWLNADNVEQAARRLNELEAFAGDHGLRLVRVGLDIEPPRDDMDAVMSGDLRALAAVFRRRRSVQAVAQARSGYTGLCEQIRRRGRIVESYTLPPMLDEVSVGSTLLQRVLGVVDVPVDDRVPMAYSSYIGRTLTASYSRSSTCVALGVTGGGVYEEQDVGRVLGWNRVRSELDWAAANGARRLYLFSLEGCVEQNMLGQLAAWTPGDPPSLRSRAMLGDVLRGGLRGALRLTEPPRYRWRTLWRPACARPESAVRIRCGPWRRTAQRSPRRGAP